MRLLAAIAALTLVALVACSSSTSSPTPATPRGMIAFGRVINANGDQHLFTIRADGTGEKLLVTTPSCCLVWSHGGDRLLLAASGTSAGSITTAIVNADGSDYRVLSLDSSLNLGPGAWSPDDSRLAFDGWDDIHPSLNGLYTADAAGGGNRRRLTTTTDALHDIPISYSPDGSRILFWRGPADTSQPGLLFLVGVDGSRLTKVSPPTLTVGLDNGNPGGWSPDGAHISFAAFSPDTSDSGRSAVFVSAGDGTDPKQITDWGSWTTSARWSPKGDWIVFDKINATAGAHTFYFVHPDGSGIRTIPSLSSVCCAVWSPDGDSLLFLRGPDRATDLWTVKTDGSQLTQVTHTPADYPEIGWSSATK